MRAIWRLFTGDLKRIAHNTVTAIIVFGLVAIPSLFSWYNLIACWNVFDNTGNLTVAVANSDEGYKSDLVPIEVNVGEQVVSALRANDQLKWTFTDEEDAIDGARSGRYYAAVVIPESFSRDMMTFYSDDVEHAKIAYYTNEKKNAIAPKVTDQGADGVSSQVNQVFAETLSEVALGLASALSDYADEADVNGRIGELASHIDDAGTRVDKAASVLGMYSSVLGSAQGLIEDSGAL
ncbi:MAG: YhgE/Pip family protein, partial [Slackia piriformis]|nr:YhgE/Pip family protein [Slackia piriformis]